MTNTLTIRNDKSILTIFPNVNGARLELYRYVDGKSCVVSIDDLELCALTSWLIHSYKQNFTAVYLDTMDTFVLSCFRFRNKYILRITHRTPKWIAFDDTVMCASGDMARFIAWAEDIHLKFNNLPETSESTLTRIREMK